MMFGQLQWQPTLTARVLNLIVLQKRAWGDLEETGYPDRRHA